MPDGRITQSPAEILQDAAAQVRLSQEAAEYLEDGGPTNRARVSQVAFEILIAPANGASFPLPFFPARWITAHGRAAA